MGEQWMHEKLRKIRPESKRSMMYVFNYVDAIWRKATARFDSSSANALGNFVVLIIFLLTWRSLRWARRQLWARAKAAVDRRALARRASIPIKAWKQKASAEVRRHSQREGKSATEEIKDLVTTKDSVAADQDDRKHQPDPETNTNVAADARPGKGRKKKAKTSDRCASYQSKLKSTRETLADVREIDQTAEAPAFGVDLQHGSTREVGSFSRRRTYNASTVTSKKSRRKMRMTEEFSSVPRSEDIDTADAGAVSDTDLFQPEAAYVDEEDDDSGQNSRAVLEEDDEDGFQNSSAALEQEDKDSCKEQILGRPAHDVETVGSTAASCGDSISEGDGVVTGDDEDVPSGLLDRRNATAIGQPICQQRGAWQHTCLVVAAAFASAGDAALSEAEDIVIGDDEDEHAVLDRCRSTATGVTCHMLEVDRQEDAANNILHPHAATETNSDTQKLLGVWRQRPKFVCGVPLSPVVPSSGSSPSEHDDVVTGVEDTTTGLVKCQMHTSIEGFSRKALRSKKKCLPRPYKQADTGVAPSASTESCWDGAVPRHDGGDDEDAKKDVMCRRQRDTATDRGRDRPPGNWELPCNFPRVVMPALAMVSPSESVAQGDGDDEEDDYEYISAVGTLPMPLWAWAEGPALMSEIPRLQAQTAARLLEALGCDESDLQHVLAEPEAPDSNDLGADAGSTQSDSEPAQLPPVGAFTDGMQFYTPWVSTNGDQLFTDGTQLYAALYVPVDAGPGLPLAGCSYEEEVWDSCWDSSWQPCAGW